MKEIIIKIEEDSFQNGWKTYDGFLITTTKQVIKLGVENGQQCCEHWGYFLNEDNIDEFIGVEILDIKIVDECLNIKRLEGFYEGVTMFVNIETDKGTLQFTAYNSHNGFYNHEAIVVSNKLNKSEIL